MLVKELMRVLEKADPEALVVIDDVDPMYNGTSEARLDTAILSHNGTIYGDHMPVLHPSDKKVDVVVICPG